MTMNLEELILYSMCAIGVASLLWHLPQGIDLILLAPIIVLLTPTLLSYGNINCR